MDDLPGRKNSARTFSLNHVSNSHHNCNHNLTYRCTLLLMKNNFCPGGKDHLHPFVSSWLLQVHLCSNKRVMRKMCLACAANNKDNSKVTANVLMDLQRIAWNPTQLLKSINLNSAIKLPWNIKSFCPAKGKWPWNERLNPATVKKEWTNSLIFMKNID